MGNIIVYGSKYGATRRYAEELSRLTDIKCINYKDVDSLSEYDNVIFLGGIYAGVVKGMLKVSTKLGDNQKIIIVTVGIGDAYSPKTIDKLDNDIKMAVGDDIFARAKCFHLRGAIDYAKLNKVESLGMKVMYKMLSKKKEEDRSDDVKAMLDTYGGAHDFVDFDKLTPIVEAISTL